MISTEWHAAVEARELESVRTLADEVAAADGVSAFSEPTWLDLTAPESSVDTRHLLARDGTTLVAYAHVDQTDPADVVVELAVHPGHRRRGVGTVLTDLLAAELPTARAWAHGDHPGAAHLAARSGHHRARELWRMRRPRDAGPLPELVVPDGAAIRPLRVGTDEAAVVAVNNCAFSWHPEQGHWDLAALRRLEGESWFDADGVLLAWDTATGELLGFHWTKVHERSASVPESLGEVYVVGVDPSAQGRGLGRALTLAGLRHLAERGLDTVILYVEGDNPAAITTYRHLGFARDAIDVSYGPPAS